MGYTVVETRWRAPELNGDLDLIAWDGAALVVVEVKTRTARDLTPAASAIDEPKRNLLRQMGRAYLRTLPRQRETPIVLRFDVVSVYLLGGLDKSSLRIECELLKNAFASSSDLHGPLHPRYGV